MKRKNIQKYLPAVLMGTCLLAGLIYILTHENFSVEQIVNFTPKNPWLAVFILWMLYAVKGVTAVILYDVLVLAAAFMFDTPAALAINTVGTLICISVPYFVGRCMTGDWLERTLSKNEKLSRLYQRHQQRPVVGCLLLRSMGLSNEALGFLFGSTGMKYPPYLICSFCGISPGMICITILGSELTLRSVWFWIVLAIDLAMIVGSYWYDRKKKENDKKSNRLNRPVAPK